MDRYEEKARGEKDFASHARNLEEKVISLNEKLREKEDISKSIESLDGLEHAKRLLAVSGPDAAVEFDEFHPVVNEFLEEIRSTLEVRGLALCFSLLDSPTPPRPLLSTHEVSGRDK